MSESVRILVVKTSSLGDVVHTLPAVSDIATACPGATIDWICEEGFAGIPALHPAVDRVIPCAIRRWRTSWWTSATRREVALFREAVRNVRYDTAIDFQGLLKSAWIMRGVGDALRHGYAWSNAREPLSTLALDVRHTVPWGQHAIVRNRQLAAASLRYAPGGAVRYGISIDETARALTSLAPMPPASGSHALTPPASMPTAVVLHSTSRADKAWPEPNWRAIVERMGADGFNVVLPWGSEDERARSQRLAQGQAATVPPKMDMNELARLFAAASMVVGVDTGLVHLAVAAGAPTIAIFGPTDPALTGVVAERAPAVNLGGNGTAPAIDEVAEAIASMMASAR